MSNVSDQRQEQRLGTEETVFIEVDSAAQNDKHNTLIVISHSVDISANGLQLILDEQLPNGSIYEVCVQLSDPERRLHMTAEVKWTQFVEEEGGYMTGLYLFESDDTDIQQWKEMIAERFG